MADNADVNLLSVSLIDAAVERNMRTPIIAFLLFLSLAAPTNAQTSGTPQGGNPGNRPVQVQPPLREPPDFHRQPVESPPAGSTPTPKPQNGSFYGCVSREMAWSTLTGQQYVHEFDLRDDQGGTSTLFLTTAGLKLAFPEEPIPGNSSRADDVAWATVVDILRSAGESRSHIYFTYVDRTVTAVGIDWIDSCPP